MTPSPSPADAGGNAEQRSRALLGLRRYEEAADAARAGLAADPNDPQLVRLLAASLCEAGDLTEALAAARQAVALQPDSPWAHQILGWTIYKWGRHADAAAQLGHSLALDPDEAETHVMRAEALLKQADRAPSRRTGLGKKLIDQAEWHGSEAIRLEPAEAGGYLMRAKACFARGWTVPAEGWVRQGLSVEPDNPVGHQLLGAAAQLRGNTREAADHFVTAGKLNPRSRTPMAMLRGLRRAALPIGGVALFVALGVLRVVGRAAGGAGAVVALVGVVTAVVAYSLGARWWARRSMSEEARAALARDRELRGRKLPFPRLR